MKEPSEESLKEMPELDEEQLKRAQRRHTTCEACETRMGLGDCNFCAQFRRRHPQETRIRVLEEEVRRLRDDNAIMQQTILKLEGKT